MEADDLGKKKNAQDVKGRRKRNSESFQEELPLYLQPAEQDSHPPVII